MPATIWQQLKNMFTPIAGMARSYKLYNLWTYHDA